MCRSHCFRVLVSLKCIFSQQNFTLPKNLVRLCQESVLTCLFLWKIAIIICETNMNKKNLFIWFKSIIYSTLVQIYIHQFFPWIFTHVKHTTSNPALSYCTCANIKNEISKRPFELEPDFFQHYSPDNFQNRVRFDFTIVIVPWRLPLGPDSIYWQYSTLNFTKAVDTTQSLRKSILNPTK